MEVQEVARSAEKELGYPNLKPEQVKTLVRDVMCLTCF